MPVFLSGPVQLTTSATTGVIVEVAAPHVGAAVQFYVDVFGVALTGWRTSAICLLALGPISLRICDEDAYFRTHTRPGPDFVRRIEFPVPDVRAYVERACEAGAELLVEMRMGDGGGTPVRAQVRDPYGLRWEFVRDEARVGAQRAGAPRRPKALA